MMRPVSTSETSVNFYHSTRGNNPESSHVTALCRKNLKCPDASSSIFNAPSVSSVTFHLAREMLAARGLP
jgi:hypothetical protein